MKMHLYPFFDVRLDNDKIGVRREVVAFKPMRADGGALQLI